MSCKNNVPENQQSKFKERFLLVLTKNIDRILENAHFYATHHYYGDCQKIDGDCDDCWGDSDERDLKEDTKEFYSTLWKDVCSTIIIQEEDEDNGVEE